MNYKKFIDVLENYSVSLERLMFNLEAIESMIGEAAYGEYEPIKEPETCKQLNYIDNLMNSVLEVIRIRRNEFDKLIETGASFEKTFDRIGNLDKVTAEEAIEFSEHMKAADMQTATTMYNELLNRFTSVYGYEYGKSIALSALWNAGRVHGVREERAKCNQ